MLFHKSLSIPVPGLIFSLLGLGWCIFMSLGIAAEFTCITSGCSVVENVRIFGISPWWVAVGLFGLMAFFALLRLRTLAYLVALFFLLGDCLFLLVMLFLAPCTNCLIFALLLFCSWLALRSKFTTLVVPRRIFAGVMSGLWLLLFLFNIGPVLNELVSPRLLLEKPGATVAVYISPSCPACLHAVRNFEGAAEFYALAKNEEDLALVADLEERLRSGSSLTAAMEFIDEARRAGTYRAPELSFWQELNLRFALMRNQARLSRLGVDSLPVIMFEGLPASWAKPRTTVTGPGPALPPSGQGAEQKPGPEQNSNAAGAKPEAEPAKAEGEMSAEEKAAVEEFLRKHRQGGCVDLNNFVVVDENGNIISDVNSAKDSGKATETAPAENGKGGENTAPAEAGSPETGPAAENTRPSTPPQENTQAVSPGLPDLPGELLDPVLDCGPNRAEPCGP